MYFKMVSLSFLRKKQHIDKGPVMVDFDFRYDTSIENKQHTETTY